MWLSTTCLLKKKMPKSEELIIEEAGQKAVLIPGDLKDESFARQLVHDAAKALDGFRYFGLECGYATSGQKILKI